KTVAIAEEFHPRVTYSITSVSSEYEAHVESHIEHLPPSPEREIFAVSFPPFLKLVRRLPILLLIEQFLVGNVFAAGQELPNFEDCVAFHREGPSDIASHWKCWTRSLTSKERLRYRSSGSVVGLRNYFCDHGSCILSRQLKK